MTLIEFPGGKITLHRADRAEREPRLLSTDLLDLAVAYPELLPVWEELQHRRNEMGYEN